MRQRLLMFLLGLALSGTGWYWRGREIELYEPMPPKATIEIETLEYVVLSVQLKNGNKIILVPKSTFEDYTAPATVWRAGKSPNGNEYDGPALEARNLIVGKR